jgi:hypothetical protein
LYSLYLEVQEVSNNRFPTFKVAPIYMFLASNRKDLKKKGNSFI